MDKLNNETRRAVIKQSLKTEIKAEKRLNRILEVLENNNIYEKGNIFCKLHSELYDIIHDMYYDFAVHDEKIQQNKREKGKLQELDDNMNDETRRAVLFQSLLSEARSRTRLKRINDVIEDHILENDLDNDTIFCKLHKKISDIIEDIEADIDIHRLELNKMEIEDKDCDTVVVVYCDKKVDKVFSTLESADEYVEVQEDYDKFTFREFRILA